MMAFKLSFESKNRKLCAKPEIAIGDDGQANKKSRHLRAHSSIG